MVATIIISSKTPMINLKEIFSFRDVLRFMIAKEFKVIYQNTKLGYVWAVLNPLLTVLVLTFVFRKIGNGNSTQMPISIFYLSGIVLWNFFSGSVLMANNAMVSQSNIIKKVYFPRVYIPISVLAVKGLDLLISLILLLGFLIYYKSLTLAFVLYLPILIIGVFLSSLGFSLLTSALSALYKDFRFALPFMIQILFFASPILYTMHSATISELPEYQLGILAINPILYLIELMRFGIDSQIVINPNWMLISFVSSLFILILGIFYYHKVSVKLADIL